jgi:trypsin-like peptidase
MDLGEGPFLVTASHVISRARERGDESNFHFLVGQSEIPLASRIISDSEALDVATLRLTRGEVASIEQDGYRVCQPPSWPPPDVSSETSIITAGFPRHGRSSISWDGLDLAVETVRAFVRSASEDQFTTHLDPEYTVRNVVDVSAPEREPAFEGFSGGPAFMVSLDGPLVVPHLCGIVKEGGVSNLAPGRIVLHYARIHRLQRNGAIG